MDGRSIPKVGVYRPHFYWAILLPRRRPSSSRPARKRLAARTGVVHPATPWCCPSTSDMARVSVDAILASSTGGFQCFPNIEFDYLGYRASRHSSRIFQVGPPSDVEATRSNRFGCTISSMARFEARFKALALPRSSRKPSKLVVARIDPIGNAGGGSSR
jgi:hypothetical protein